MEVDPDAADVRRVLAGDLSAFEGIVRRWQRPLINLAYRLCRDRGRAEEMAQDAFLQIYRRLDRFRADAAFSTWAFAVSMNLYRSTLRRLKLPAVSLDAIAELADPRSPHHRELEEVDAHEAVRRAVSCLPARYRDALVLYYFRGMDVTETGRILGVPEGTIKARLNRGRDMLRRRLSGIFSSRPLVKEA